MPTPDDEFYWDWYKHEENLTTSRGSFFLVGESMLFAGYAALRAGPTPRASTAIVLFSSLGVFAACVWLLVGVLHSINIRNPLICKLEEQEKRRAAISGHASHGWRRTFKSFSLMGFFLPGGILACWLLLLILQGS
jgi:uncharacterized membrane protein YesL